jgi:hypothetical protein
MTKTQHVRQAKISDIARLGDLAAQFYASSAFLGRFDMSLFCQFWENVIEGGNGVIFLLESEDVIQGALGGMAHREPYCAEWVAHEFFFFIGAAHRGGFGFLKLYRAFEGWAKSLKCSTIRMVHLQDLAPEQMGRLYRRLDFTPIETVYSKALVP